MQQAEAVRKGVVQLSLLPCAYYDGIVPLGSMMLLSEVTPAEERASGAYDIINELHKKAGLFYLERGYAYKELVIFNIFVKQPIEKPQQLAGKKIGSTSLSIEPFLKTVGAAAAIIAAPEIYNALERGVVDGFSYPLPNFVDAQLYAVCKYAIDHAFLGGGKAFIVNPDSWNRLPPNLQKIVTDTAAEVVVEQMNDYDNEMARALKIALDNGVKFIKFSDADREWFYQSIYDSMWADNIKRYPEVATKLKPMFSKQ